MYLILYMLIALLGFKLLKSMDLYVALFTLPSSKTVLDIWQDAQKEKKKKQLFEALSQLIH